jgi:hypothetical protein
MNLIISPLFAAAVFSIFTVIFPVRSHAGDSSFPFGSLTADIENKVINQGVLAKTGSGISFPQADLSSGFRDIKIYSLDIHAGIYAGWFNDATDFAGTLFGAGGAILPVVGSNVISNRFAPDQQTASNSASLDIPAHAADLANWHENDSVSYTVSGGVIFSAGVGYAMTGLSGDYYVRGDWTTYVEKLDAQKVFVKITNVHLTDFDLMAGNVLASEILSHFDKSDSYFSYIFDLSNAFAASAYESMIHGSVKPAQDLSSSSPELAELDLSERGNTSGHQSRFFLGIPFLNLSFNSGQLLNFSDTTFHIDGTESDVNYGLYWNESDHNAFSEHSAKSQSFYGISYNDLSASDSQTVIDSGKYGRLVLSFENDHSSANSVQDSLSQMIQHTGLREQLAVQGDLPSGQLNYTNLSLTIVISDAATQQLIAPGFSDQLTYSRAQTEANSYFDDLGDVDQICTEISPDPATAADYEEQCQENVTDDVAAAVSDMQNALKKMSVAEANHQDTDFVQAYAAFGKAMLKNEMSFAIIQKLLGNQSFDITFNAMGTNIPQLTQKLSF